MWKDKSVILLVSDDTETAQLIQRFLNAYNYEVRHANHALDALVRLDTTVDAVIVGDYATPGLSGRDFCSLAKKRRDVPLIGIAGFDQDDLKDLLAHFDHILFKPFRLKTLAKSLDILLKRARCQLN